ncbi:MAG: hypothetical protein KBD16_02215 [Candidatus Pacebacteria bacterium]|nr:hypothetical protein [Candidatus Paceibacterota bacterium]
MKSFLPVSVFGLHKVGLLVLAGCGHHKRRASRDLVVDIRTSLYHGGVGGVEVVRAERASNHRCVVELVDRTTNPENPLVITYFIDLRRRAPALTKSGFIRRASFISHARLLNEQSKPRVVRPSPSIYTRQQDWRRQNR